MKRVYLANDPVSANVLKARLEALGIHSVIQDERTYSMRGEVPLVYPSVWVADEDEPQARQVALELAAPEPQAPWTCTSCGEVLDGTFTACWKCSANGEASEATPETPPAERPASRLFMAVVLAGSVVAAWVFYQIYLRHNAATHFDTAYKHQVGGRMKDAVGEYGKSLQYVAGDATAHFNRGLAYSSLRQFELAIRDFDRVIEVDPAYENVHESRAHARVELGRFRDALADYLAALAGNGHRTDIRLSITHCKYALGDLDGALHEANRLTAAGARLAWAGMYRALIHCERGNPAAAQSEIEAAMELDPEDEEIRYSIAWIYSMHGNDIRALQELDKLAQLRQGRDECADLVLRGFCLFKLGNPEFKAAMEAALKLKESSIYDAGNRALAYALLDKADESNQELDRFLKSAHEDRWSFYLAACTTRHLARSESPAVRAEADEKALGYLEEAGRRGFVFWKSVEAEPFLKHLYSHPRFKKLARLP